MFSFFTVCTVRVHTRAYRRGPGAVVKAACLERRRSRIRTPLWLSSVKESNCFFPAHSYIFNIVGSLRGREVAWSASDRHGSNFESSVWRTVSSHSSHHLILAQCSLCVHKGGLTPHSFHLFTLAYIMCIVFYGAKNVLLTYTL